MRLGPEPKPIGTIENCNGGRFINDTDRPVIVHSRCTRGANVVSTRMEPGDVVRFFTVPGQSHKVIR